MNNKIIIVNGPNLNLLGQREQSQYGSTTFKKLKENCLKKSNQIGIEIEFTQSNIEGELVNLNLSIFLKQLKIPLKKVAIELNQEIIDKNKTNKIKLKKNDKIEIVHFIGGG